MNSGLVLQWGKGPWEGGLAGRPMTMTRGGADLRGSKAVLLEGQEQVIVRGYNQRGYLSMEKGEGMANLRRSKSGVTEKEGSIRCQKICVCTKELVCSNIWLLFLLLHSAQGVTILMDQDTWSGPRTSPDSHKAPQRPNKSLLWDRRPHLPSSNSRCGLLLSRVPYPYPAPTIALFPLDCHYRWLC